MKIEFEIPDYDNGVKLVWEGNYNISVETHENRTVIKANEAGLISLAKQLLTIAESEVPVGTHIHYDEFNSLEDGSDELIIRKIP